MPPALPPSLRPDLFVVAQPSRRGRRRLLPRRQQPSHGTVVVRCLPIPLRHVDVMAKVQVALSRPFAQPVQRVEDQLARRLGCEKRAGRRVEGENAVGAGGDSPPAFVNQVMMEGTLCRLPDYADFQGSGPHRSWERTVVSVWAGGIIRARSGRQAGGREAGSGGQPQGLGLFSPRHVPSQRGRLRDRRVWFPRTRVRARAR